MYKAILSGHIFVEPEMGSNIEVFTYTDNDDEHTDIMCDVQLEVLKHLEHHLRDNTGELVEHWDHFFIAIVYAKFVPYVSYEGTEYDVEYDIHEIKDITDLDKEANF